MIGTIIVLLIIIGVAAYQYFKGSIVRAIATIMVTIVACIVAFGYFEYLGTLLSGYMESVASWSQLICFTLLFLICFALFQTAIITLLKDPISLGELAEKIGRPICGVVLGWILSGVVLTAAAMAPIPNGYPYPRFDDRTPKPDSPNKVLLNSDGLVTGLFSTISKGSFSAIKNARSFTTLHPAFLDQLYLNRHAIGQDISLMTSGKDSAINVPKKAACWPAPDNLVDADGQTVNANAGQKPMLVRVGFNRKALKDGGCDFTLSQLRIICKEKGEGDNHLVGQGTNVYPMGYMVGKNQMTRKRLNEKLSVSSDDFKDESTRNIDFVISVPTGQTPVLAQYKLNNMVEIPKPASLEQAPTVTPFGKNIKEKKKDNSASRRTDQTQRNTSSQQQQENQGVTLDRLGITGDPTAIN